MHIINEETFRDAFLEILNRLTTDGMHEEVNIADKPTSMTRELHPCMIEISNPRRRHLFVPYRGNNPFQALAESIWVFAGRNDIRWIEPFMPRAEDFSDDGVTWRAGYGPRLRRYESVISGVGFSIDQIRYCLTELKRDWYTRRAVMTIWRPDREIMASEKEQVTRDYPCCDFVQFMYRNGKLDIQVVVRSNDAIWGFSSINFYEWSLLQEMIADELGVDVGKFNYLATSMHIYEHHIKRAHKMSDNSMEVPMDMINMNFKECRTDLTISRCETIANIIAHRNEVIEAETFEQTPFHLEFPYMDSRNVCWYLWLYLRHWAGKIDVNEAIAQLDNNWHISDRTDMWLAARWWFEKKSQGKHVPIKTMLEDMGYSIEEVDNA